MSPSMANKQPIILEVNQLSVRSKQNGKQLLHNMDLVIRSGETVGLVGESGSGKSITASTIMGLLPPQLEVNHGHISFKQQNLQTLSTKEMRSLRGKEIGMVFQDYNGSLTPFIKIGKLMIETLCVHEQLSKKQARDIALDALHRVKLPETRIFNSYPFQLSGGQKQRVAIAMAMMLRPSLIIADEPTTALDVVTGERILELLTELQQDLGCGVLLISHHLGEIVKWTDSLAVMYGGHVVEEGKTKVISQKAKHPYTQLLLQSRPSLKVKPERLLTIPGEPGDFSEVGCPFVNRCPSMIGTCLTKKIEPVYIEQQRVACHLFSESESYQSIGIEV